MKNILFGHTRVLSMALFLAGIVAILSIAGPAAAQAEFGIAPPGALDGISGGPVGGGGAGMNALQGLQNLPPGQQPFPGGGAPGQFGGFGGQPGQIGGFQVPAYQAPRRLQAIEGQRIFDAISYRLNPADSRILDDPRRLEVIEEEKSGFSDDGRTLGDREANDGLWSRIIEPASTDEYTGGLSHFYLLRIINMLSAAQQMNPLEFFGLNALTSERFSKIEKRAEREADRDDRIYQVDAEGNFRDCWSKKFLDLFRIEQGNPHSDFFPLYIPQPPPPPAVQPPPGWLPPQAIKTGVEAQIEQALNLYRAANPEGLTEEELEDRIDELRGELLDDEEARNEFFRLYGIEAAPPAPGGGFEGGGYYQMPAAGEFIGA
ncbi:hypothetical protein HQ520_01040 [bacterium]|nr:hypothetical protein [bacterium]